MGLEVLEISIQNRTVRVHAMVWSFTIGNTSNVVFNVVPANLEPYVLSANRNSLVILGCGFQATARTTMRRSKEPPCSLCVVLYHTRSAE